jgi:hypothetical protein
MRGFLNIDGCGTYTEERKVIFATFNAGFDSDKERMKELGFVVGKTYTLTCLDVDRCSSLVYLKEFPGKSFNSVFFEEVGCE